jgi:hypothetical protein
MVENLETLLDDCLTIANTMERKGIEDLVHPAMVEAIVNLAAPAVKVEAPATASVDEFIKGILSIPVAMFATIGTLTTVADSKLIKPKANGISGRFQCLTTSQVVVNGNYARMVNARMGQECGDGETFKDRFGEEFAEGFTPAPRTWGKRVVINGKLVGLVKHNGEYYLDTALMRNIGQTFWFEDGRQVDYSEIAEHFHPKRESKRQPLPTDRKVKWRTWKMESLLTASITPCTEPRICTRLIIDH